MSVLNEQQFINYFKEVDDPRQDGTVLCPLEAMFLLLVNVIGGSEGGKQSLLLVKLTPSSD